MVNFIPNRDLALKILKQYTQNNSLIRHALTMEAVMRYFAELLYQKEILNGKIVPDKENTSKQKETSNLEDAEESTKKAEIEKWAIIGLLHDIDYEKYPDKHCLMVREILSSYGFPEEYLRAIESHGYKIVTNVEPIKTMEKILYATDELTGLISATVFLRPSKSIMDLEVSSVKKKWKQKSFAAGVNREIIEDGAKMLGVELDWLIEHTIKGMQTVAEEIGLKGEKISNKICQNFF